MSTEARVNTLEQAMLRTQENLDRLSEEMRASAERADRRSDQADRRWGELANKMGTLVEDIVAPGLPKVFRDVFGSELDPDLAIRVRRHHLVDRGRAREFDAIASAGDLFLINETRSRLKPEDVPEFLAVLREARDFLPEARGKRLVGAIASFYVDPSLVAAGERQGLLVLGLGRGLLEVLNSPEFHPREI